MMDSIAILKPFALLLGLYMAWNIGANDVANAMGTSVGSKALTLRRAVLLAAVLEFSGAFFVGSNVSETIQSGIIDPLIFEHNSTVFVLGMLGSLLSTGILLQIASYFGLPVSTTHAIVGAVIGFGAVIGGIDAIHWGGVGWIAASWVISPVLSGFLAHGIFRAIQHNILYASNPAQAVQKFTPFFVFLCFSVMSLSLLSDRIAAQFQLSNPLIFSLSLGASSFAAAMSYFLLQRTSQAALPHSHPFSNELPTDSVPPQDVEKTFVYLQILSACLVAFAHGANDVANAIGPVAAILGALKTQTIAVQTEVPIWLLALGGGGIVAGLATWGWRVIETVGKKITELTPTRGFSAEFGAAATILLASKLGLPISTTHALIGAILGVGMARGIKALNLRIIREIALSWIVTIPLCAGLSIVSFYVLKWIFL
jgi:phosphate/sulfate permease